MNISETSSAKSKSKNTTQSSLEELITTEDLALLKRTIIELTNKQDYRTFNTLFSRNPIANNFQYQNT